MGTFRNYLNDAKTVNEIIRMFGEQNELISFYLEEGNHILIKSENVEIISRLINGEFPNYKEIIPKNFSFSFLFERALLISKVKAVSAFSGNSNNIMFLFEKNTLTLSAKESGAGEGNSTITLEKPFTSNPLLITFNWRFLLDGLEGVDSEKVEMKINSEVQPIPFEPGHKTNFFYLLMPIKH